jgi:hypothetical protein
MTFYRQLSQVFGYSGTIFNRPPGGTLLLRRLQRVHLFDKSHGAFICVNEWLLFEDGARRERNPLGALISPPQDSRQRAQNIVQYHQERLKLAVAEFDHFKKNHMINAKVALRQSNVPAPVEQPDSIISKLRTLQEKVKQCRKQLDKAKAELDKHTPQRVRDVQATNNRNREASQNLLKEISAIEI